MVDVVEIFSIENQIIFDLLLFLKNFRKIILTKYVNTYRKKPRFYKYLQFPWFKEESKFRNWECITYLGQESKELSKRIERKGIFFFLLNILKQIKSIFLCGYQRRCFVGGFIKYQFTLYFWQTFSRKLISYYIYI